MRREQARAATYDDDADDELDDDREPDVDGSGEFRDDVDADLDVGDDLGDDGLAVAVLVLVALVCESRGQYSLCVRVDGRIDGRIDEGAYSASRCQGRS